MWKHGHSGYTNHKCRCEICRAAVNAYNRSIQTEYRERPQVEAYCRRYQAAYRSRKRAEKKAYGETYKKRHRQELLAKERAKKRTPEGLMKARRDGENRRARKLDQFLEDVDPHIVYQMHGGRCGICGEFVEEDGFHVDHVIPLSRGGSHGYVNVQPAHARCNLSKGAKT